MVITVKRGLIRAGRIIVDHDTYRVRRDGKGSFIVSKSDADASGLVRYLKWRDLLFLENPPHKVEIRFLPGETSFEFDNRTYRIEPMTDGHVAFSSPAILHCSEEHSLPGSSEFLSS